MITPEQANRLREECIRLNVDIYRFLRELGVERFEEITDIDAALTKIGGMK